MFYVEEVKHGRAVLREEAAQHLRKVLRAERGQKYELSDNAGLWLAEVEDFSRDEVVFRVLEALPCPAAPPAVVLAAALVKFDAFEWMLEKATELGAAQIVPVETIRSERGLEVAAVKRKARWERIVMEAGQQSRRIPLPELTAPRPFGEALQLDAAQRVFLDEQGGEPLLSVLRAETPVALLIGPEGGWDDRERAAALAAGWKPASLGPTILRAETAALAALAIAAARLAAVL